MDNSGRGERGARRKVLPPNMYIISCGNENEIVMEPETGYVPNNPLFGLPPAQLDKVSEREQERDTAQGCRFIISARDSPRESATEEFRLYSVH